VPPAGIPDDVATTRLGGAIYDRSVFVDMETQRYTTLSRACCGLDPLDPFVSQYRYLADRGVLTEFAAFACRINCSFPVLGFPIVITQGLSHRK
jgi:hypothetical protein